MNSLSFFELQDFSNWLQEEMQGAQLQDLWTNGQLLVFQFYKFKEIFLLLDTNPQRPLLVYLEERPQVEKKQKPIVLFLSSHGKNLRWNQCKVEASKGRVLDVELTGGARTCRLEFQLIPKAFNLLVEAGEKKIAWEKPRELPPAQIPEGQLDEPVDWVARGQEWLAEKFQIKPKERKASADPRMKALEKKKNALLAIEEQLKEDASEVWKLLGEHLKISADVPAELEKHYDSKKSRSWNMENAFDQAKHLQKKRAGTEERFQKIKEEIAALELDLQNHPEPIAALAPKESKASKLLEKTQTKGRRIQLDGGFEALMGKSAADNLAILRKAQAWDLWLHLKDYPGSHAIIIRPRNKEVPQSVIQKVSEWLIKESLGNQKIQWGLKYDVVVAECRYVRPIKGDKLGRVTYHHPQVYSFASKS